MLMRNLFFAVKFLRTAWHLDAVADGGFC